MNYINGVEIKRIEGNCRGRGIFASKAFKKGDLIAVEKAIIDSKSEQLELKDKDCTFADIEDHTFKKMLKECMFLTKLKGP